jgi:hypothetical protein
MLRFPIPLAALLLSLTACAGPAVAPATVAPADAINRMAGKVVTEENLTLFFGLLRQSLTAAAEGRPAPELSAEEKARLEASSKQLQREALEASMKMLNQVEKEMRETIRTEALGR